MFFICEKFVDMSDTVEESALSVLQMFCIKSSLVSDISFVFVDCVKPKPDKNSVPKMLIPFFKEYIYDAIKSSPPL